MSSTRRRLTIFHLTDVHGRVEPGPSRDLRAIRTLLRPGARAECTAGLAALEQVLCERRQACADWPALLLYCGDFIGTEMVNDWVGNGQLTLQALVSLAEAADLEDCFAVVGNHELDCGLDNLLSLRREAKPFQLVADNLRLDGKPVSTPWVVDAGGIRVALVSATTERTSVDAPDADRTRVAVDEPVQAVRDALEQVRRRAAGENDVAIGIVHLADSQDKVLLEEGGLDLLLGGHSHRFQWQLGDSSHAAWAKAGCYAQVLGVVQLQLDSGSVSVVADETYFVPACLDSGAGSVVLERYQEAMAQIRAKRPELFEPVARLPAAIGDLWRIRRSDQPLGRLVADMMLATARSLSDDPIHFAFINGGNIRAELATKDGLVRPVDLHGVLPYGNRLLIVEVDARTVNQVVGNHIACVIEDPPGFLQVAGIRYEVGADGTVRDLLIEDPAAGGSSRWRPPAELGTLRLATIDYLIRGEGGHHYGFLDDHQVTETGVELVQAWLGELKRRASGGDLAEIIAPSDARVELDPGFGSLPPAEVLNAVDHGLGDTLAWWREKLSEG